MLYSNLKVTIEKSRDNIDIFKIDKNEKQIYIGSKYNTSGLVENFIENINRDINEDDILLVYGFGSAYNIEKLSEKFKENKIIVFEPNLNLSEYIHKQENVKLCENVQVLCDESMDIYNYILNNVKPFNIPKIKLVNLFNYESIYDKEYVVFRKQINDIIKNSIVDFNTRLLFNQRWFEALIENIPYIVKSTPVNSYSNKFANKPAVIVSAGPSLENNIYELENAKDTMMIISGGRTLRSLLNINIEPHIVAVVDPGEASYGLVKDYISDINSPLLFYEKTNEKVVQKHKGKKIFFTQSTIIRKIFAQDIPSYIAGGSVAHTMTKMAVELGCNPIIFIGQDLAYTNQKTHAQIADYKYDEEISEAMRDCFDCFTEGIDGNKVRTTIVLEGFRRELETLISEYPNIKFINATEGGARIKGTIEMPLKECVEKYGTEKTEFHFEDVIQDVGIIKQRSQDVLAELRNSYEEIVKVCKKSLGLLEDLKINYMLKKNNKVNSLLKKLDYMDSIIKEECLKFNELESVIYPILHKTILGKNEDGNGDKLNNAINSSREMYTGIIDELAKIEPILNSVFSNVIEK